MSAFNETDYRIRLQLVDEKGQTIESYISPKIGWLKAIRYFENVNKTKWTSEIKKVVKPMSKKEYENEIEIRKMRTRMRLIKR